MKLWGIKVTSYDGNYAENHFMNIFNNSALKWKSNLQNHFGGIHELTFDEKAWRKGFMQVSNEIF